MGQNADDRAFRTKDIHEVDPPWSLHRALSTISTPTALINYLVNLGAESAFN